MDKITFIKATNPSRVCKTYTLTDGVLDKIAVAKVIEGTAFPRQVDTAQEFMELLHRVTDAPDIAIIPGEFHGAGDARFNIVTEGELARMMRTNLGEGPGGTPGGVQDINGSRVAARLRRGISPSAWFLVDADNPPGIPDEWRAMSIQQRLEMFEPVLPGISKCERIELRASSARVHKEGEEPGQASHAWIRVSDAEKIEVLRELINAEMVIRDLSFLSPRYRRDTGEKIGRGEDRTVFDLSVLIPGRLVFCAKPDVSKAPGYVCADANITLVNEGGGVLDLSKVKLPSAKALAAVKAKTGIEYRFSESGGVIKASSVGELTMDTLIEVKGRYQTLAQWAEEMGPGAKLRCEAPFRASSSEAAFIRTYNDGPPTVYDVGVSTNYTIRRSDYLSVLNAFDDVTAATANDDTARAFNHKALSVPRSDLATDPPNCVGLNGFDARDYAYLTTDNQFVSMVSGEKMDTSAFNLAHKRNTPRVVKTKMARGGEVEYLAEPSAGSFALDDIGIPVFATEIYAPTMTDDLVILMHKQRMLNSFRLDSVPEVDPDWEEHTGWQKCEAHIRNLIPEGADELIKWMGFVAQNIGKKVKWTPIIKGVEGDGKTLIAKMVAAAVGQTNTRIISPDEISSDFSGWAQGGVFGVLEEIRVSGQNRHAIMNRLKPFITNDEVSVVRKGRDGVNVPNVMNYMALTNFDDALAITADDRRWYVLFSKYTKREAMLRDMPPEYFSELFDFVRNNPSVLRGWLMSIDTTDFNPNFAPKSTTAKNVMIENSRSNDEVDVEEAIALGGVGVGPTVLATHYLNAALNKFRTNLTTSRQSAVLTRLGWHKIDRQIKWRGEVVRVYVRDDNILSANLSTANYMIRNALNDTIARDFDLVVEDNDTVAEQGAAKPFYDEEDNSDLDGFLELELR